MKEVIAYIWRFVKPYKVRLFSSLLLLVGVTFSTLAEPYLYKLIIDTLTTFQNDPTAAIHSTAVYMMIWAVISVTGLILFILYRYILNVIFLDVHADYYKYAFTKVVDLDVRKHLEKKSGELVKKFDNASDAIFYLPFQLFVSLLPSWMTFIAIIIAASLIHWPMTLITASFIPVYILIFSFGAIRTGKKQREAIDRYNEAIGRAYDTVANIQVVKSFVQEKREFDLFNELINQATIFQKKVSRTWTWLSSSDFFLRIATRFVIFVGGIYFITQGTLTMGSLIMFLAFSSSIYAPLQELGYELRDMQKRALDITVGKESIEQSLEVVDVPKAKTIRVQKGKIEYHNVSFSYSPSKKVLKDVSFIAPSGKITAFVGRSGAGKTTIISLLNRFYDVTSGTITIDGQNIKKVSQASLRRSIGMVMQENTMFNDTIYNNIHYANSESNRKDVMEAAKKANIHEFIESLPEQYETKVGERGLKLSGGEKQRIAIARVILKNPPILVLDEATSALDSETEGMIQDALEKIMKERTTLVIAHRLSTVRKAHQIIVLEKGKIVEWGTHEELLEQKGVYKHMVDLQVRGFLK
jgi:ATP-binding cassette subfamily B protein